MGVTEADVSVIYYCYYLLTYLQVVYFVLNMLSYKLKTGWDQLWAGVRPLDGMVRSGLRLGAHQLQMPVCVRVCVRARAPMCANPIIFSFC